MLTLGDYSSLLEIGFGLNLAVSYVNLFVNPSVLRAERGLAGFRWWVDAPERLHEVEGKRLDAEEFEEALANWTDAIDRMTRAIDKHRKWPTGLALVAACLLYTAMYFPSAPAQTRELIAIAVLSILPVVGGSIYLWFRTKSERVAERQACKSANSLFVRA
jgi:hypothetical protein